MAAIPHRIRHHVGGHALLKAQTGARMLISTADMPILADGGRCDFWGGGDEQWRPIKADGVIEQGVEVKVSPVVLTDHLTLGHTRGNTIWTMAVEDGGRRHQACFVASMRLNPGVPLVPAPAVDATRPPDVGRSLNLELLCHPFGSTT